MSARIRIQDDGWRLHLKWFADDSALLHQILDDFKETFSRHCERCYSSTTRTAGGGRPSGYGQAEPSRPGRLARAGRRRQRSLGEEGLVSRAEEWTQ